jgi:putative addiction module CopG family antidote
MNVSLPTPLAEFAKRKVAAGEFESVDEVVCEGLRLLQLREQWKNESASKIDVGWEQAKSGRVLSPEEVQKDLKSRKAEWLGKGR